MTSRKRRSIKTTHKQVSVEYIAGKIVEVDEGIAPLLQAMWKLGIETTFSCQSCTDYRGKSDSDLSRGPHVHIEFREQQYQIAFLNTVADNLTEDLSLAPRRRIYCCMVTPFMYTDSWQYSVSVDDESHDVADISKIDAVPTGRADFGFSYHVTFPVKHYQAVLAAIVKAVATQEARQNEIRRVIDSIEIHTG